MPEIENIGIFCFHTTAAAASTGIIPLQKPTCKATIKRDSKCASGKTLHKLQSRIENYSMYICVGNQKLFLYINLWTFSKEFQRNYRAHRR